MSSSEDGSVLVIDAYDFQVVGRWATDTAISAVDCANIQGAQAIPSDAMRIMHSLHLRVHRLELSLCPIFIYEKSDCLLQTTCMMRPCVGVRALTRAGGHVAFGDETGLITILATHVGLCGRWQSF